MGSAALRLRAAAASKSSSGRAGVVEEDVEAAVLSLACGEEPLDRSGVGQVGGRHERRQAARIRDQAGRLLQRRLSPACEHQRTTRLRASKAAQKSIQAFRLRRAPPCLGVARRSPRPPAGPGQLRPRPVVPTHKPALASANAEARPMPLPDPVTSATLPCSDGTTEEQSVRRASTDVAASGERAARRIETERE